MPCFDICINLFDVGGWSLEPASILMTRWKMAESYLKASQCSAVDGSPDSASGSNDGNSSVHEAVNSRGVLHPAPWSLFAFPAESNFSGVCYDPALGQATATLQVPGSSLAGDTPRRWAVLLDAAKACGSRPPDLTLNPVDFVVSTGSNISNCH